MPAYEIEHITALSAHQKDQLAVAVTKIHSRLFTTLSLLVNVRFTDVSKHETYVGGKRRSTNRIFIHVRPGGGRSAEDFAKLWKQLTESWNEIVNGGQDGQGEKELRAAFVLGDVVAGFEAGLTVSPRKAQADFSSQRPQAGQDRAWIKDNMHIFRKRAEDGDEDFQLVMEEIKSRSDLSEL